MYMTIRITRAWMYMTISMDVHDNKDDKSVDVHDHKHGCTQQYG